MKYLTTFDDKTIHFGFTLGVNMLDFNVVNYNPIGENPDFVHQDWQLGPDITDVDSSFVRSDVATLVPGFTVGIVSSLRISRDLTLRFLPGMSFGERKLTYNIPVSDINNTAPNAILFHKVNFPRFSSAYKI